MAPVWIPVPPGEIELGEDIPVEEIPMNSASGVAESAHDLAAIIDITGSGSRGVRDIELRKNVIFQDFSKI